MATYDQIGNSIPAPSFRKGGSTVDDELLYSTVGYTQKGVTLKPGQGVLLLGTLIKKDTSTKYYVKTTDPATAEGVLRQTTDTGSSADAQIWQQNIVIAGILKLSKLQAANSGVNLSNFVGARVNATMGTFKF
jgi:hypothetical protein